jgi:hypothetical protein
LTTLKSKILIILKYSMWYVVMKAASTLKKYIYCIRKAIPLQALTGAEGSRRLRLPNIKTFDT